MQDNSHPAREQYVAAAQAIARGIAIPKDQQNQLAAGIVALIERLQREHQRETAILRREREGLAEFAKFVVNR